MNTSETAAAANGPLTAVDHGDAVTAESARINILLVDDEPKNLTVLETILADPGYRLIRAESADQALLALVVEEFAVLVLDINMPGMNGFELAKMIKQRRKTASIPIIFLTAYYSETQHVLEGYETGAVDYLHKPVNPTILRSKVAIFVELYRKNRECALANRALLAEVAERRRMQDQLVQLNVDLERRVEERTAQLLEAARQKDQFLSMLAHELRNPLAPIQTAAEILRLSGSTPAHKQSALAVIDRQVSDLRRLLDDLLDVSRVTRGRIELRKERTALAEVVARAIESSRTQIDRLKHHLEVSMPPQPVWLEADATRLVQVVANLLNNAAKYTDPGGQIHLSALVEGGAVVLRVQDNGIGIAPEMLAKVFDLFMQADTSLDRSHGGLGIGLTVVRRLVELHGGCVEAHSDGPGRGSAFVVRLPILTDAESTETLPPVDGNVSLPQGSLRVLIVDDNKDFAVGLGMLLRSAGHKVHIAHDGPQALSAAESFCPQVVSLDIGLPGLDGYQVARRLRNLPGLEDVLIVAISGYGDPESQRLAQEAGCDARLLKPVKIHELMQLIATRIPALLPSHARSAAQ